MTKLRLGHEGAWSPNGAQIAFLVGRGISVMRSNGTGTRAVKARVPGFTSDAPKWTRDGTRLLIQAIADRAQYDLFTSNADGSRLRRLTHTKQDEILPAWSPTGRRIAFVRGRLRDQSIWVSSSSATNLRRLHDGTYPSWSPSGTRLAFEDDGIVYTMSDRGGDVRPFASGAMPAWSPDGRQIALVRGPALFVADAETRQRRMIADFSACEGEEGDGGTAVLQQPAWSPDSRTIGIPWLCDHGRWSEGDTWLIDVTSGSRRSLSPDAGPTTRLAWSPDGRWIGFATGYTFARLAAIRPDGTGLRTISISAGDDRDLDWR